MTWMTQFPDRSDNGGSRPGEHGSTSANGLTIPSNIRRLEDGRTLHVALTGTSNSILGNGFSAGIGTHPNVGLFLNKSTGASGSVAIPAHMPNLNLTNYQYLLIDYCVNEAFLVSNGLETIENVFRHMAALIDFAVRQGCLPVLVNLPTRPAVGQDMPVPAMLEAEFVSRGVPMLDAQSLIETLARRLGRPVEDLFLDEAHLKRPVAFEIGQCAVRLLERCRRAGAIDRVGRQTDAVYGRVGFIPAEALITNGLCTVERSNRLLRLQLLQVGAGQSITVPAPPPGRRHVLRGVAYNATRSIGRLISEKDDLLLDVGRSHYFGMDRDLLLISFPSPFPDRPISDEVTFICEGVDEDDADKHPMAFEIAGIMVHDPDVHYPLHTISVHEDFRHLNDILDEDDFAWLGAAWDKAG